MLPSINPRKWGVANRPSARLVQVFVVVVVVVVVVPAAVAGVAAALAADVLTVNWPTGGKR